MEIKTLYEIWQKNNLEIQTDTRKIVPNSLFFALKGDRFDGNSYAAFALQSGAAFAVVDNPSIVQNDKYLLVDDVLSTLQKLASFHRCMLKTKIIGITGSNGKTTTKELVYRVLSNSYKTMATPGNFNNHIGVPLSILQINQSHEYAVIEIGANQPGEVAMLCNIVQPDFGICTTIGKEHLEGFGSIEAILENETAIYDAVVYRNGLLFAHHDNQLLREKASRFTPVFWYGTTADCDCVGKFKQEDLTIKFAWETTPKLLHRAPFIETNLMGAYNFVNMLAAAAIGRYFSVPYDKINLALSSYKPINNRSQLININDKTIILDAYNANPHSMEAAIENLKSSSAKSKMVFLGDMYELGNASIDEHQNIVNLLKNLTLQRIVLLGHNFKMVLPIDDNRFYHFDTVEQCKLKMPISEWPATLILIKGSRAIALEKLLD